MTERSFRLALAQTSPLPGDVAGNVAMIRAARARAATAGADLVLFPAAALAGTSSAALLRRPAFLDTCRRACEDLARETADGGPALLLGLPWREDASLYAAQALLDGGLIQAVRFQVAVGGSVSAPFEAGPLPGPVPFRGLLRLGLVSGDDLADEEVPECLAETGAELLLSSAAAVYRRGGADHRLNRTVARVVETGLPLVWLNAVGGGEEGICDGASFVLAADRSLTHQLPAFRDALTVTRWTRRGGVWVCEPGEAIPLEAGDEADYAACMLGLREHLRLAPETGVLVEFNDEASLLGSALAVDALGPERVAAVRLAGGNPGGLAATEAEAAAAALGLSLRAIPVSEVAGAVAEALTAAGLPGPRDATTVARTALLSALARGMGRCLLAPAARHATCGLEAIGDLNPVGDLSHAEITRLLDLRRRWKPAEALGPDRLSLGAVPPSPEALRREAVLGALGAGERVSDIVAAGHEASAVMALQQEARAAAAVARRAPPSIRLTDQQEAWPARHGFVDDGEPAYRPDEALVKGVGRSGGDSIDF